MTIRDVPPKATNVPSVATGAVSCSTVHSRFLLMFIACSLGCSDTSTTNDSGPPADAVVASDAIVAFDAAPDGIADATADGIADATADGIADATADVVDASSTTDSGDASFDAADDAAGADADADASATSACSGTATSQQVFDTTMTGCEAPGNPASIAYASRATLCASACHVCTAAEWVTHHGSVAPISTYWTGDNPLNYVSGSTNSCTVSATSGSNICTNGSMAVCPTGGHCNLSGCGLNNTTNAYFGGCTTPSASSAEGTLCCCP